MSRFDTVTFFLFLILAGINALQGDTAMVVMDCFVAYLVRDGGL